MVIGACASLQSHEDCFVSKKTHTPLRTVTHFGVAGAVPGFMILLQGTPLAEGSRFKVADYQAAASIDLMQLAVQSRAVDRVDFHDAKTDLELTRKPRIGAAKGEFSIPDSFFDPLPDELIKAFGGA
jgi:hypothetical protein